MLPKTYASSPGGTTILSGLLAARPLAGIANRYYVATDYELLFRDNGVAWSLVAGTPYESIIAYFEFWGNNLHASVANRAWASPIQVHHPCKAIRMGAAATDGFAGDLQELGIYDSAFNLLATTGALNVNLQVRAITWYDLITNPILPAGFYWLAEVCNANYVTGVSGIGYYRGQGFVVTSDPFDFGANYATVMMNAAYPLPAVFVPVVSAGEYRSLGLKVTIP